LKEKAPTLVPLSILLLALFGDFFPPFWICFCLELADFTRNSVEELEDFFFGRYRSVPLTSTK
jgi:hypothetical protein